MSLRTRLLLGYGLLTVALLASVCGAALVFHVLGRGIDRVLEENVASVRVATQLIELLERHNANVFRALSARRGEAGPQEEAAFFAALRQARSNITVAGELEVIDDIEIAYRDLAGASDRLLAAPLEDPIAQYEREVAPAFAACSAKLHTLLDLNTTAIHAADRRARRLATQSSIVFATLAAAGLMLLTLVSSQMHRHLWEPLAGLREAAESMAGGDTQRRLPRQVDNELGQLAALLNTVLDERDSAVGRTQGVLAQQRQLVLAVLVSLGEPAALIGLDGAIIASTLGDDETQRLIASESELRAAWRSLSEAQRSHPLTLNLRTGQPVQLRLLLSPPDRALGWLVRFL
ncbi:MAG: HAMP domain-containing protein [Acidobacteriota bacterium]|jgi:HAMP domain-containing protein